MDNNEFYKLFGKRVYISELVVLDHQSVFPFEMSDCGEFVDRVLEHGGNDNENVIGSAIKKQRLDLKLTLEEVSSDICCLAYLSKLERNKVVNVYTPYVSKICERIGLNYEELCSISPNQTISLLYKYYLNGQNDAITDMVNHFQTSVYVASEELCTAFHALLLHDLNSFSQIMKKIDEVKNTLSTNEVIFMLFIMAKYATLTLQMKKAYTYLVYLNRFDIKDISLKALTQELMFQVMSELSDSNYRYEYIKLKNYYELNLPYPSQMKAELLLKRSEPTLDNLEKLENMSIQFVYDNCKEDYYYTLAYLNLMNDKIYEGLDVITSSSIRTSKFVALYGLGVLILMGKNCPKNRLKDYKKEFDLYCKHITSGLDDNLHIAFIELMKVELNKETTNFICDFIKYRFLGFFDVYQYKIYKKYLNTRYLSLLGSLSRYKDAYVYALNNMVESRDADFYAILPKVNFSKIKKENKKLLETEETLETVGTVGTVKLNQNQTDNQLDNEIKQDAELERSDEKGIHYHILNHILNN